jgi:hypothetical protein
MNTVPESSLRFRVTRDRVNGTDRNGGSVAVVDVVRWLVTGRYDPTARTEGAATRLTASTLFERVRRGRNVLAQLGRSLTDGGPGQRREGGFNGMNE